MFDVIYLNELRKEEARAIIPLLPAAARVLEIGGGTGVQALELARAGFDVTSVDLPDSNYRQHQVYPIISYDGSHLPFGPASFDVLYSSNVLEHIASPSVLHAECMRVLRPGGFALHVLPSATWRLWTSLTHYADLPVHLATDVSAAVAAVRSRQDGSKALPRRAPQESDETPSVVAAKVVAALPKRLRHAAWPVRHGERGNSLSELWYFSRAAWKRYFRSHGFDVREVIPMRMFYTGTMLFGGHLSFRSRATLARVAGSSVILYRVTPNRQAHCGCP